MNDQSRLNPTTVAQIDALSLTRRPLIICDVDEVLLHFVRALEGYLEREGYWLDRTSFALNGNIRAKTDDEPAGIAEIHGMISNFFSQESGRLDPIEGARDSLASFAEIADVVLLTNLPERYRDSRITNLQKHGFNHPVVTNDGLKGPAAHRIAVKSGKPVFFLDDAPNNVQSVGEALPDAHIIHFVPDERFSEVLEDVDGVHLRSGDWAETHRYIWSVLNAEN